MRSDFEDDIRLRSRRLAELRDRAAEIVRELSDTRLSLEREIAESDVGQPAPDEWAAGPPSYPDWDDPGPGLEPAFAAPPGNAEEYQASDLAGAAPPGNAEEYQAGVLADELRFAGERTEILVNHGRRSAAGGPLRRWHKVAIAVAAAAVLLTVAVLLLSGGGGGWPASVATVQREVTRACQNPDVKSEPGQVNFACGKATSQVLWVFALMTSGDNPGFADAKTGRVGLEPITPAQGGQIAWSLNLHHPYSPLNPIDSLQVAARAINNIIGGATVTGSNGSPVVQPGLESDPANCIRYTGSAAVRQHRGFPASCAKPVTSPAGEAALVADVYQKWFVGAAPQDAQDAAVLFANAQNPGDPQVQSILRHLPGHSG